MIASLNPFIGSLIITIFIYNHSGWIICHHDSHTLCVCQLIELLMGWYYNMCSSSYPAFALQMGWSIFSEYIHAVGTRFIVLIVSSVIAFQATAVYANVWLSEWTDDLLLGNDTIDHEGAMYRSRNDLYLGIYGFLGIIQGNDNRVNLVITVIIIIKPRHLLPSHPKRRRGFLCIHFRIF